MKAKVMVIGEPQLVRGFRLVGLEDCVIADEKNFQKELEKALSREDIGIIIVTEHLLNSLDWRIKKKIDSIAYPIIIPVIGVKGERLEGADLRALIKRALGFDLMQK